jgi:Flp pilus assembly protein TadG
MRTLKKALRDEKGASIIFVAIAMVVILGFAVLAIDASLMQLAKTQLQNAADAAALAGAMALAKNEFNEDSATVEAIRVAGLNIAVQDIQRPVVIGPNDVRITWILNKYRGVEVTTHRTGATNDSVTLYFLKVLDPSLGNKGDVTAKATATFLPICATDCLKPWCIPDRWKDTNHNKKWDPGESYDPVSTGYQALNDINDIGVQVTLRPVNSDSLWELERYFAVDFPPKNTGDPVTGREAYRMWITVCEPYMVNVGDPPDLLQIEQEPTVDKTEQGLDSLIELDEGAYWDEGTKTVKGSAYPTSPRIVKLTAFDPTIGVQDAGHGRKYVTVSKIIVLFIERHDGADIVGRFMRLVTQGTSGTDCPGGFAVKVALVKNE